MKLLTKNKLNKIIEEAIRVAKEEAYKKGYADGLHNGLTSEKEGVHLNGNGIYMFNDEESKSVIHSEDLAALKSDWEAVGKEMKSVMF